MHKNSNVPSFHPFVKPCFGPLSLFVHELRIVAKDVRSRKIFSLIAFNCLCLMILTAWCFSTNSLCLCVFTVVIWMDLLSLLTCLLGFWAEQKKPNRIFTFGHVRWEILCAFVVIIVAIIGSILVMKDVVIRMFDQQEVHTGRLLLGLILCQICHLVILYSTTSKPFNYIFTFASSNLLQDQLTKFSQSLCQTVPGLSALLLPRVNPFILFGWITFTLSSFVHILIEAYNYFFADTIIASLLVIGLIITLSPITTYTASILLQTAPVHMIGHLDKCLREALTFDGVLEFRNEHFWTLGYNTIVGSLHVRIRRDANEQVVLNHLSHRLSGLVSDLTIQVFKDEWAWNPSPRFLHKDQSTIMKYTQANTSYTSSTVTSNASSTAPTNVSTKNSECSINLDEKWVQNV